MASTRDAPANPCRMYGRTAVYGSCRPRGMARESTLRLPEPRGEVTRRASVGSLARTFAAISCAYLSITFERIL